MGVGARHRDAAGLDRLAQGFQGGALELRQLVEEQHAEMGERNLARLGAHAAADQRRAARPNDADRGTGRRRISLPSASWPATECTMLTSSASAGSSGGRSAGSRAASIDLPAPGGPSISRLWPPAAATSSARLAVSWPLMSRRSR